MGPVRRSKSKAKATTLLTPPLSPPQPSDWWHDFTKRIYGSSQKSPDPQSFESMFKMSMKTFDYICSLVKGQMMSKNSSFIDLTGNPLTIHDMVATVLTRLGSGDSLKAVGTLLNLNQTTVAQLTKRFVDTLIVQGLPHIQWPATQDEMEGVKRKFEKIGGLPNCCGAIDTTNILMSLSTVDRSTGVWVDRVNNQSMTIQAIVGPDLRFRDVIGGCPGSFTDERIHKQSAFFEKCINGERLNGKKRKLSEGNEVEEYIAGNSGMPLLKWLVTPYEGYAISEDEEKFNEMLFKTQMVAKEALIKLKENWKIIKGVMWRPDKNRLPTIILACCILHNILIDMKDGVQKRLDFSHLRHSDYREMICDSSDDPDGLVLRDKIFGYLSGRLMT